MQGILSKVEGNPKIDNINPNSFREPIQGTYSDLPTVGKGFIITNDEALDIPYGNRVVYTSNVIEVQQADYDKNVTLFRTQSGSLYVLQTLPELADSETDTAEHEFIKQVAIDIFGEK